MNRKMLVGIGALAAIGAAGWLVRASSKNDNCAPFSQSAREALTKKNATQYRGIRDGLWNACRDKAMLTEFDAKALAIERIPPTPPPPPEPTLHERLKSRRQLASAIAVVRPLLEDETDNIGDGAALLAVWSSSYMKWAELLALPETKRALVMRDPEAERGKRLCVRGTIVEIHADRSAGTPIYDGGLMTSSYDIVRFLAVRSAGTLLEKSPARFCGVVIGRCSYGNSAGGVTHGVRAVGMFDLKENKE